jgi:hypothetical protein
VEVFGKGGSGEAGTNEVFAIVSLGRVPNRTRVRSRLVFAACKMGITGSNSPSVNMGTCGMPVGVFGRSLAVSSDCGVWTRALRSQCVCEWCTN